jgi:hypothetical protein
MKIILNSKQYDVENIVEKQVSPFITKIGNASLEWQNYAHCDVEEYRDFRGGLGLESEESLTGRFYWSDSVETTKEGYITLGPLVTTAGTFGAAPVTMQDFPVSGTMRTFAFGNSVAKYWTTSWQTADSSALANPTDSIVATDATSNYLIVCNGADVRYTSDGTSWSSLSTENLKYLCMFDKRLIGMDAAYKKLWYSPREDVDGTLASFNLAGDWSVVTDLFSGKLLTTGDPCIYMLTDMGLWAIDFYTQTCYKMEVRYPYTTNAKVGMYWNSYLFIGTGAGISRVTPSTVTQWGTDLDDGLPADYQGYVYDMVGTSHWVIMAMAGGTKDSIFKRHESVGGWHQVYSSSSAIQCLHYSSIFTNGRLWFGDGTDIKYIQFPDTTHDVTKVSGYEYAASGDLYLSQFSRVSSMPKIAIQLDALTKSLDTDEKITPYYIVNNSPSLDSDDWTALGTWTTTPQPTSVFNSYLGTSFYDICFKLHFERGDTTTNTPVLKSMGFKFVALPDSVMAWQFVIRATGNDAKKNITDLETARDSSTLVNFSPDGDTNISQKYVRIVSMPANRSKEGYAKEMTYTVTVAEVV